MIALKSVVERLLGSLGDHRILVSKPACATYVFQSDRSVRDHQQHGNQGDTFRPPMVLIIESESSQT